MLGRHIRLKWVGELIDMRALSWGRAFSMLAKTTGDCADMLLGWVLEAWGKQRPVLLEMLEFLC